MLSAACALLATAPAAVASCRVTDYTDRPLSSLSEIQRLSFVRQMTKTEYDRLKPAPAGSANYYALLANSTNRAQARDQAQAKLAALKLQNVDDYATIWASEFLTDDKQREFVTCSSWRRPGIVFAGRLEGRDTFQLSFAHLTPIGVEKIRLRLVASRNVANAEKFQAFLDGLGEKDNYVAQTFPLTIERPGEPAVLVLRAGWETPQFVYIPAYPAPEIH